uniref:Uncharacterized protein n=1 Tax=Panagrolaimus sp. PS1159 TaxID=55785 RepID=A0AC35EYV8_9BILA
MFTKTAEVITFERVTVKDSDGSIVPFEKIFETLFNVKKFVFFPESTPNITFKTFDDLLKIPHFSRLISMTLWYIPKFDIENFYVHMKKNKTTKFFLFFDKSISASYKIRLEEIIDEILSTNVFNYKPPIIAFDELDEAKENRLFSLLL